MIQLEMVCFALLGLAVGSFLSVVVVRLPKMLAQQLADECALHFPDAHRTADHAGARKPYNLALPGSHAPCCGHRLRWYENLPVLSFMGLRGRCAGCGAPIPWLYPALELATALLFAACAWRFGLGPVALAWAGLCSALLALACIDWQTTLLPDAITLPLTWAGLVASALGWSGVPLPTAVWGAVAGYLSLWSVYWVFKAVTGKDGMGYGDFKLFAALGAWLGWPMLIPLILLASVVGALVGLGMKFTVGLRAGGILPFGPFLAGAGVLAVVLGPAQFMRWIGW